MHAMFPNNKKKKKIRILQSVFHSAAQTKQVNYTQKSEVLTKAMSDNTNVKLFFFLLLILETHLT